MQTIKTITIMKLNQKKALKQQKQNEQEAKIRAEKRAKHIK